MTTLIDLIWQPQNGFYFNHELHELHSNFVRITFNHELHELHSNFAEDCDEVA